VKQLFFEVPATCLAAREAQGWREARRLRRSKDSSHPQSFCEENKEAPAQEVTLHTRCKFDRLDD
jgi:hypothetical protein